MSLQEFTIKCLLATFCISFCIFLAAYLFFNNVPKYEMIDSTHKLDKVSGQVYRYYDDWSGRGWTKG